MFEPVFIGGIKTLSSYYQPLMAELYKAHNVVICTSKKVLEQHPHHVMIGYVLYPEKEVALIREKAERIFSLGVQADLNENGIDNIIFRELLNDECFLTGILEDVTKKLTVTYAKYVPNLNEQYIRKVFADRFNEKYC